MLDPIRLVTDLFKEKNLSDGNLQTFSEQFLIRLSLPDNNPGGIYNQLLVDTTTCHQNLFGAMTTEKTKAAISKGITITVNDAFDAVIRKLRSLQNLVIYKYTEDSSVYREFFPKGMAQYHHVALANAEVIFVRFRAFATMYLLADYPGEVAELNALINGYLNAFKAKENIYAERDIIATDRHVYRKALTLQLTKSFLIIASDHLENPDKFDDYYEPRYLPIRKAKKKKEKPVT